MYLYAGAIVGFALAAYLIVRGFWSRWDKGQQAIIEKTSDENIIKSEIEDAGVEALAKQNVAEAIKNAPNASPTDL